ncbi:outer membrane beta-barrel protein [Flavobacterium sp. GA093]|uniref:Outer membrane beta-barrel protein n=1 Tax=Flavobacterium hydrocarbonoxydans TaxID=2683249 RepID=A0A6I4NP33_9FLAO|nr:porin [Flavobacterium hydrocarbonoxydans]MWB95990.1 outer membrane beta-barrel protein [Flavobacterium hydrocarbonoxydans]
MKKVLFILSLALTTSFAFAQEEDASETTPLEITGSGDLYYKYDFAKVGNIPTSFATDHNSVSLGMLDIALKKKIKNVSFVGEISFGPRGQYQSIPNGDGTDDNSFHIQNLYATYAVTDKLSLTAGYMGTFIGYEVISPVGNFHYSTSYLFTNGPFQNAGVKANYAITDQFGFMVGLFNDTWNTYKADPVKGLNAVGGQFSFVADKMSAYLNVMDGSVSGTIFDLTSTFQITDKFKLGLNAADFSNEGDVGYTGAALYPSFAISDAFALGLRGEYFKYKEGSGDTDVTALTLSGNFKINGLTIIPEFRLDSNSDEVMFVDSDLAPAKSASQVLIAVVYGF